MNAHAKITATTATLAQLKPGSEYPGGNINARTYATDVVAGRAESLMAFGQLQSLTVCPAPNKAGPPFYVAAGSLRLAAFEALVKEKRLPADHPINITVKSDWDGAMALAASIEENRQRTPMHPVNEYEQFAELVARGKTVVDICSLYGMPEKEALGILALGQLHPEIRTAFRDGKIKAEIAKAYTISPDQKRQLAAFKKLAKDRWVSGDDVRKELVGNDADCVPMIAYIGKAAYEAAGGKVMEDLFGTSHGVSDPGLAKKLAHEKMDADKQRMVADGWAWAAFPDELHRDYRYNWARIEAKPDYTPEEKKRLAFIDKRTTEINDLDEDGGADNDIYEEGERLDAEKAAIEAAGMSRAYTDKQKAKSGVVLSLDDAGRLVVNSGFVKPSDVQNVATKELNSTGQKKKKKAAAGISNALAQRLSETLTEATAIALAKDPKVALPAMIAGFTALNTPVKVSEGGLYVQGAKHHSRMKSGAFAPAFQTLLKAGLAKQTEALAHIAADALDFKVITSEKKPLSDPNIVALTAAMDGKALNAALRAAFKAQDYFSGVSSAMRVAAIREACGDGPADTAAKLKKDGQTKFAVANVPKSGWLPPELRTSHYDGPAGKTKAKKAPKAKPAKKAR